MSRFFSELYASAQPYTPGEQPRDRSYVKLNTNENPFPPSTEALSYTTVKTFLRPLNLYSDPESQELREALANSLGVAPENVLPGNGSDEILNFAFMAFCSPSRGVAFPDVTYGFYAVLAGLYGIDTKLVPLREDFSVGAEDYFGLGRTIFLANPNAPTGLALPAEEIGRVAGANPDNVVVVDEAYVDFGGESCVPLTQRYNNLLVVQTFSKSRSMAGARLGFAVGDAALIADLNRIKYAVNPYNVNSMTAAMGIATLNDPDYTLTNCAAIVTARLYLTSQLRARDFEVLESSANFVFAKSPDFGGEALYAGLKEKGVLVRHFAKPERIADYVRISVGTREQLDALLAAIDTLREELP
ncbi:MAG: histidinol-phosphate transaminase [Oscillospiraceae bacterium]|nr:histidinol-phosphate transaminase [Oscillospiraceae bacterium]